jgi:hypothetical protein
MSSSIRKNKSRDQVDKSFGPEHDFDTMQVCVANIFTSGPRAPAVVGIAAPTLLSWATEQVERLHAAKKKRADRGSCENGDEEDSDTSYYSDSPFGGRRRRC